MHCRQDQLFRIDLHDVGFVSAHDLGRNVIPVVRVSGAVNFDLYCLGFSALKRQSERRSPLMRFSTYSVVAKEIVTGSEPEDCSLSPPPQAVKVVSVI